VIVLGFEDTVKYSIKNRIMQTSFAYIDSDAKIVITALQYL